jgi:hypothetical protein
LTGEDEVTFIDMSGLIIALTALASSEKEVRKIEKESLLLVVDNHATVWDICFR